MDTMCISYIDTQIGKIINAIKENNLLENTIIVCGGIMAGTLEIMVSGQTILTLNSNAISSDNS